MNTSPPPSHTHTPTPPPPSPPPPPPPHTHTHTYIHTCMHVYMHTYMHAYIHTCIHSITEHNNLRFPSLHEPTQPYRNYVLIYNTYYFRTLIACSYHLLTCVHTVSLSSGVLPAGAGLSDPPRGSDPVLLCGHRLYHHGRPRHRHRRSRQVNRYTPPRSLSSLCIHDLPCKRGANV